MNWARSLLLGATLVAGAAGIAASRMDRPAEPASLALPAMKPAPRLVDGHYRFGTLGDVAVYAPKGATRGVALFLSGDGGWNAGVVDMARALAGQGLVVAGVSTPALMKSMEADRSHCIAIGGPLVSLAQDLQHRYGFADYRKPILVGYSSGATIAYAALAQGPAAAYRGVISLGFGPDMPGKKPWCAGDGLSASHMTTPVPGWLFGPIRQAASPWTVLQGMQDQVVSPQATAAFVGQVGGAKLISLPKVGHGYSVEANWMPQFIAAAKPLLDSAEPVTAAANAIPDDLPLNIATDASARPTDMMAVIYSGDGGWVGLDRAVAGELAHAGIPTVGVDSLSYFWNAKTPAQAGADLGRIVRAFAPRWRRTRIVLIGYSFGADALPYIVGHIDPALRGGIARITLLGLSRSAEFQFHLDSWIDVTNAGALPTAPAIARLRGIDIRCVQGASERDSACPTLARGLVTRFVVPGGHHFDGNAALLSRIATQGLIA
jgi:type IV secretory pathway VirJ component